MLTDGKPITSFRGEYDFLSNFYPAEIRIGDVAFPTNEHAFQAAKHRYMLDTDPQRRLEYVLFTAQAPTPAKAKHAGRSVKIDVDSWDAARIDAMRLICRLKFDSHPDLQERLIKTGGGMLVEGNDWGDKYWGRVDGKGKNVLGSILMELRGYYFWRQNDQG